MTRNIMVGAAILVCALLLFSPIHTRADVIPFELSYEFSAGDQPRGSVPWLIAAFEDYSTGTVRLTLSASGLIDSEFVGGTTGDNPQNGWYFNFDPGTDPVNLDFNYVSGNEADGTYKDTDAFVAGSDGAFDILFVWRPNRPDGTLSAGEEVVYDITYTGGTLEASWFDYQSAASGPQGIYHTAAHVQGIVLPIPNGVTEGSGWIADGAPVHDGAPVPEPPTLFLLGSGLIGVGVSVRRKLKR